MPRVIHFEIHATEPEALVAFYSGLLGWAFVKQGAMDYWLIETGPRDQPGIDGGLVQRPVAGPAEGPALNAFVCTVQVDSLDETLTASERLGGVVALPRMPVPGVGWLAYIKDPDGNMLGLLQPDAAAALPDGGADPATG
ncbi:MAG: VOC family protein [Thermoleophilia bacterium]